jgi:hypothetical protein
MALLIQGSITLSEMLQLAFVSRLDLYKPIGQQNVKSKNVSKECIKWMPYEQFYLNCIKKYDIERWKNKLKAYIW